ESVPGALAVLENRNLFVSLLLNVITRPPGGATPFSRMFAAVSSLFPTATLAGISPAEVTPAVSLLAPCAGMLKPARMFRLNVVEPGFEALNCAVALADPPASAAGEPVIVPTDKFELSTSTLAVAPARSACASTKFKDASRRAGYTVSAVLTPWLT